MKKLILATAISGAVLAGNAMAADTQSTVKFEGKVVDQTCTIQTSSQDQTVVLATIPTNALATQGATAAPTPFSIALANCKINGAQNNNSGVTKVKAYFYSNTNINTDNNAYTLKNTADQATAAQNVNIKLFNKDGTTAITPSKEGLLDTGNKKVGIQDSSEGETIDTATPTLHYVAKYYATDAGVTAGKVASSIDFNIVYE